MSPSQQLNLIKIAFDEIASAVGKEKEPLVRRTENTDAGRALRLLLDPSVVFHLDKKSLAKQVYLLPSYRFTTIFSVCNYLSEKNGLTDQDIANVQGWIAGLDLGVQDFAREFLAKSIRLGVTVKTLNKCYEEKVPVISCMLANKYFDHASVVEGESFAITEKLDGIRCLAVVRHGERPVLYSRQGQKIEGLSRIEEELLDARNRTGIEFVVDGELLIENRKDKPSKQQYKETTKIVRRKGGKEGIRLYAFDILGIDAFDEQCCDTPYYLRRQKLDTLFCDGKYVQALPILYQGDDIDMIAMHLASQRGMNHEGVMVNLLNAAYVFGRTNHLLKVKVMQDADLRILDVKRGEGKYSATLGALIVDYKGTPVGVGSGLSDEMRWKIWNNPEAYIGRVAKIRFFEETVDKDGVPSIRFPVFEEIREKGKEVSYA